jgi:hypothetical protein
MIINSDSNFSNIFVNIDNLHCIYTPNDYNMSNDSLFIFPNISYKLTNGLIGFEDREILYDTLDIDFNNSIANLKLNACNSTVFANIDFNNKKLNIKANNINDIFANNLFQKDIFSDGLIDLNINGTFEYLVGDVNLHKTTIKNVQILNNLITFINTTPAIINPILALPTLFRLSETNFDLNGYYVKNGQVNFEYDILNKQIQFNKIDTKSKMMDFKAKGNMDLKTKDIVFGVDVVFMKDHSKILNNIPIVGYIITGDDGNFITQIDVNGTLDNPRFNTHTLENISKGAGNIIKRTLNLPIKFINEIFDANLSFQEDKKQHQKALKELFGD